MITGAAGGRPTTRRFSMGVLAAFVFGVAFYAAGKRSIEDLTLIFVDAPRHVVPEGHVEQVNIVKRRVLKGSTIFYLMDKADWWQIGLWQRSLYPDYVVLPVVGSEQLRSNESRQLRENGRIEFVISAGTPPIDPGFEWQVSLPGYPNDIPTILGKLRPK